MALVPSAEAVTDQEALIESAFRRLLAAIESERERIRTLWQQIEEEKLVSETGLAQFKKDTNEYCDRERRKIDQVYEKLEEAMHRMRVMQPEKHSGVKIEINCSGQHFSVPKSALCQFTDSYLNVLFSDEISGVLPRDSKNRIFLDFNATCFGILVDYLVARAQDLKTPVPEVPPEQRMHMEVLANALNLHVLIKANALPRKHGTSLLLRGLSLTATHKGWQVIAAEQPLSQSRDTYFEVSVDNNPDPKGGLAIGVVGHQPGGSEIHRIAFDDGILYNSNNGLVGKAFAGEDVQRTVAMETGCVFGIKYRVKDHALLFFYNGHGIGTCMLKAEKLHELTMLYPCFGLYLPEQKITVDFSGKMARAI